MFRLCSRCVAYGSEWDVWKVERMQDLAKCSKLKCQRCVGSKMNPSAEQCILCTSVAKSQAHKPPKCYYWCPRLLSEIPNALINIKYCNSWKTNGWNLLAMLHLGIEISLNEAENSHAEETHSFYICVIICHRSHFVRRHTVGSQPQLLTWGCTPSTKLKAPQISTASHIAGGKSSWGRHAGLHSCPNVKLWPSHHVRAEKQPSQGMVGSPEVHRVYSRELHHCL